LALEGTGAMVFDHIGRVAYVAKSNRADPVLLERFCTSFNFEPITFDAKDAMGNAVYNTNVLMGIGTSCALVALDMIVDLERRKTMYDWLVESGHEVLALTEHQIYEFCGNAFEMSGLEGKVLAISKRALTRMWIWSSINCGAVMPWLFTMKKPAAPTLRSKMPLSKPVMAR
jgi:hypothetical protein